MTLIKRYKYHFLGFLILLLALLNAVSTHVSKATSGANELPQIETEGRLEHALELMSESRSVDVLAQPAGADLRQYVFTSVQSALPADEKQLAFAIARSIIVEANHHKMDPLFLMAVIATESGFRSKVRGNHGEIGLMQILPKTATWLADQAGIRSDNINLEDPSINIRIGATYLAHLRKSFEGRGSRYVSAYNMGSRNVRRLLASNVEPKIYQQKVMANYGRLYKETESVASSSSTQVASRE